MTAYNPEFFASIRQKLKDEQIKLGATEHYQLNPVLESFWKTQARNKVLFGGRASSKSHDAAGVAVYLTSNFTLKVMCARRFQARISESVYTLVKDKILNSPFTKDWKIYVNGMVNKRTGSEFLFYGIEKNLMEIKSTEGVDILWLEESNYITEEHWEVLEPTIRKNSSEVWFIFNPDEILDFVYDKFVTEDEPDTIVRHINWDENPWLSETMINIIENMYKSDPEKADHVYGGKPKTGGDKSIINLKYIEAAIDAHTKIEGWDHSGQRRAGFDIADDGEDLCALAGMEGNILVHVEDWEGLEDELLKSATKVWNWAHQNNATITYDSIGVGASAGSKFSELNAENKIKIDYDAFNAGGAVERPDDVFMVLPHTKILNKEHFENVKAQAWYDVGEKFRKTYERIVLGVMHPIDELISIDSSRIPPAMIKQLKKELSCVHKDISGRGKFMAEKKEKLRDRGIKSPNVADAIIMAAKKPVRAPKGFFD